MKPKRLIPFMFLLIFTLACLIPGLEAPAPVPVDSSMIPTIVVLTAAASASQTAVAQPLATETPEETSVPQMINATVDQLEDGSTQYNDHDGSFEVTFPVGWLAVRPNSDEFNTSLANNSAGNTILHDQMTTDRTAYDAKLDRLYSYILRPDIKKKYLFGFSKLKWDPEDTTTLDNDTMGKIVQDVESSWNIPGFRADTAQLYENYNAVTILEVGGRFTMNNTQGETVPIYATAVFFKPTSDSVARITFTYLKDYSAQISADVKSIIGSIKVSGQ